MTANKPSLGKLVAAVGDLEHGKSKKFIMKRAGREFEALLINYQGAYFAYVNRCPHTGITLDWVNNQFFSSDNRYLMCATHGAVFEPPSGEMEAMGRCHLSDAAGRCGPSPGGRVVSALDGSVVDGLGGELDA